MLATTVAHAMLRDGARLAEDIALMAARAAILACNAVFLWESVSSRRGQATHGSGTGTAMDSELFLLAACLLLFVWQGIYAWVSRGSTPLLAVLVSTNCGGAALLRTFGAAVLLWGSGGRSSSRDEARRVHAQLKAWWPGKVSDHAGEGQAGRASGKGAGALPSRQVADAVSALAAVAASLLAPRFLPRSAALQAICSCRASLHLLMHGCAASDDAWVPHLKHAVRPRPSARHFSLCATMQCCVGFGPLLIASRGLLCCTEASCARLSGIHW